MDIYVDSATAPGCMIIKEIRKKKKRYTMVSFSHERREANEEAHRLAKAAVYLEVGRHVWFLSPLE